MSRYSRVLELSTFSEEKLAILKSKNVLIIGAGGVCQTVATYLVTNGVENLTICDFDNAEISNLNRQILLTEKHIGEAKADIVKKQLQKRNGEAKIKSLYTKIDKNNIDHVILGFDVVVDAVDNWPTKLVISEACKKAKILSLHIGVDGESGQFCLFKNKSLSDIVDQGVLDEPRDGVLGPMVGAVSSLATLHLIRYLVGDHNFIDTLYFYKAKTNEIVKVDL
ncbi:MAG: ThiF family adenylyltransferase [Bacilli bacterium]|nr:ThiF family adenylyltransferase [Bacilli bacterium]